MSKTLAKPHDVESIKQAAAGRWCEILAQVANIPEEHLDGKKHSCPACNEADSFALVDKDRGNVICQKCFSTENDGGLAAVMYYRQVDHSAAVRLVEEYLAIAPAADPTPPWPKLDPLDSRELPEFPTQVLPSVLRDWVEAESVATQTPADLAGLLALAVCAACIARRVDVSPYPGWTEPTNLFTAILLPPANRKSAVFADATGPLREIERELVEAGRLTVARKQSERRRQEDRLKKLEKLAGEGDEVATHDADRLAEELAQQPEPTLPRLLVDDATSEKLEMILADQGGRIASMSPEGGVFDLMAGKYSRSGTPQFGVYLKGHSGDDLVTDRVGRPSVQVEKPALTCAYAIQPEVIAGLANVTAFRGRGLLARFFYAAPRSWIGSRTFAPPPVPETVDAAYSQVVRRLAATEKEITLDLTPDASARFFEWGEEVERMLGDGGAMEVIRDWGGKLAGATLRLAGVMHCVEHVPGGNIDQPTIDAAIEIARYLIPHAEHVLQIMTATQDGTVDDAQYALRWIKQNHLKEFSKRELHRHGQRRWRKAEDVAPVLAELERRGYIRPRPDEHPSKPGRKPSLIYDVRPDILGLPNSDDRGDRTRREPPQGGHTVKNVNHPQQFETEKREQVTI